MTSPEPWALSLTLRLARQARDRHDQGLSGACDLCREVWPCTSAMRAAEVIDTLTRDSQPPRAVGIAPVHSGWLAGTALTVGPIEFPDR